MKSKEAVQALSALAQESRLEVFRLLVRCGEEGLAAGQIAEQLDVPPATMSFHLKELTRAGLIEQRREGRSLIYTLDFKGMRSLLAYLTEDCCQGHPELCPPDYSKSDCRGSARSRGRKQKRM
ncbi:Cadmium resistance transcriptional regulatory protein CadC [Bremerella volcania]|uniref:Cadmium resistance transcriptional regulatory protein CadC n=1 Tax=Bremerella volcania TaxID=2527984 RepID=A0A518C5S5_9BACT|nr:metalloregulator ArsR/SmtB family transcription factor [Bremerella volcania]QDU74577.1 Cadmium resistance transcriptional regulatory protein CadC [Bremerella volcania]